MLLSLIYFLPCIVSLLWFFSYLLKKKTYRQRLFCYAEGTSVLLYAVLGIYFFPDVDYGTMVRMEAISIPLGVLTPAFVVAYMYMHGFGKKLNERLMFLLFIPAIVVAVAVNLLCSIMGFDHAAEVSRQFASDEGLTGAFDTHINHLYCAFTYYIFLCLEACYILLIFGLCVAVLYRQGYRWGDVSRFIFKGRATSSSRAIAVLYIIELAVMIVLAALGSVYLTEQVALGVFLMVVLSIVKHLIAHVEFYSDGAKQVTLYELSHLSLLDNGYAKPDPSHVPVKEGVEQEKPNLAHVKMERRYAEFCELMEVKEVWRDEDLTSASLCEMMGIGKTMLSALVNQHCDGTLRDVINRYRIDAAKRYMMNHPKDTQETVAASCGFKNAQYFNTQFKKLVGETPAMWLAGRRAP